MVLSMLIVMMQEMEPLIDIRKNHLHGIKKLSQAMAKI